MLNNRLRMIPGGKRYVIICKGDRPLADPRLCKEDAIRPNDFFLIFFLE
mgnify:CR=1 FL=1